MKGLAGAKRWIALVVVLVGLYLTQGTRERAPAADGSTDRSPSTAESGALLERGSDRIAAAFRDRESDLQVRDVGVVERVLPDDNDGSRHQRFILRLATGQTVLVAHNIDLAPRLAGIARGDTVAFNGEYEWGAEGGVIHWTHHDPAGRHQGGWLEWRGKRVQ